MMDTLSRITFLQIPRSHALSRFPTAFPTTSTPLVSVLRAGPSSVSHADEDVLQMFFKERELNEDFISRASDILWQRKLKSYIDSDDISKFTNNNSQKTQQITEINSDDGFLKLSKTEEWVLGDNSAPINKKVTAKMLQDSSARRKKLNILKYESLKREILLLSVAIGLACSGYCLMTLSVKLVPAMFGVLVYKAAVRVQVYRDNEQLQIEFPENGDGSSD